MAVHLVSFRLHEGSDYSTRWNSVVEKIRSEAVGDIWEEATSTFVFTSPKSATAICDSIYFAASIYEDRDLLIVVNLSLKEYSARGAKYPNTLFNIMSKR